MKGDITYQFNIFGVKQVGINTFPLIILASIILLVAGISIFLYKNRQVQMKLGKLNILLLSVLLALMFYYSDSIGNTIGADVKTNYQPAVIFPVVALILVFLANRAIKKDEDLVRSADRLR